MTSPSSVGEPRGVGVLTARVGPRRYVGTSTIRGRNKKPRRAFRLPQSLATSLPAHVTFYEREHPGLGQEAPGTIRLSPEPGGRLHQFLGPYLISHDRGNLGSHKRRGRVGGSGRPGRAASRSAHPEATDAVAIRVPKALISFLLFSFLFFSSPCGWGYPHICLLLSLSFVCAPRCPRSHISALHPTIPLSFYPRMTGTPLRRV